MSTPFLILIGLMLVALVVVLGMGIIGLARDGGTNPRRSNKLMQMRVAIQLAIIVVVFIVLAMSN
ncbi:twin transmembrane helix small protein [Iodidimonas sp. SYSU 1G8]|uniref:twin transmembrane helix small protein n=1 Tax=Iodidimonas sp. SYSU 1G8 TaxID=3133967 RepID=UPI0031FE492C